MLVRADSDSQNRQQFRPGAFGAHTPTDSHLPKQAKLVKPGELEKAVEFAGMRTEGRGGILVILDSDDDCPARLAPELLARARTTRGDLPSAVVLANREVECWFLASARSLRGHKGLPTDLEPPAEPETIRGAKEWLSQRMQTGAYSPNVDQASLTTLFDLEQAKHAPSFEKCFREIVRMLETLRRPPDC